MPSHIFTRVGYWKESIASNGASARAAKAQQGAARSTARHGLPGLCPSAARAGPAGERRCRRHEPDPGLQPGGSAPDPSRLPPARRATWWNAATGRARPSCRCARASFAYVDAITHFARALGAARSGDVAAAKARHRKLAELRDKLQTANDAYWTGAGRHPAADRERLGRVRGRQARRCAQGDERRGRCRRQDRKIR